MMEVVGLYEELPVGFAPCANRWKVTGWVAIEEILELESEDFIYPCDECFPDEPELEVYWCPCRMNSKRRDSSYSVLVEHLRSGGGLNDPVQFPSDCCYGLGNGHHRVIAALDAGYTHVPVWENWGEDDDWSGTPSAEGRTMRW